MRMDLKVKKFKLLEERKLFAAAVFSVACSENKLFLSVVKEEFKMSVW